jgi:serine phosphatase RsbU (regulator of sigma subunit)
MGSTREVELRVWGLGLRGRLVLMTTLALLPVAVLAGFLLFERAHGVARQARDQALVEAVRLTADVPEPEISSTGTRHENGVQRFPAHHGTPPKDAELFRLATGEGAEAREVRLLAPPAADVGRDLARQIVGVLMVVVALAALVALLVGQQVSAPIQRLIGDVRQIAKGDLKHRTHARGMGELGLLARSIDRMTVDLQEAQAAQVELSVRERELELATGVSEALLPMTTPALSGYDLGAAHLASARLGGDFHGYVERSDGRVGLLVCDVSGHGVPAALVGSTARAYLRAELEREGDVGEALRRVNRWLALDVRRGMYVTALYALVDPRAGRARVACAGHKIPLLRWRAQDRNLGVVHPAGLALGLDRGPVFDRRLEVIELVIQNGDRLLLCNSAPVKIVNRAGAELGETGFYESVLRHAPLATPAFLRGLRQDLERFAAGAGFPADISLVTLRREV